MATYLETYHAVVEQRLADYRRANRGELSWREYVRRWGVWA